MMLSQEKVVRNRALDPVAGIYELVLVGKVAATARPGQFVHLKIGNNADPLLRRPISIARIDREQRTITLFYRVTGRGTALLTRTKQKETISVIGPLGNGFTVPSAGQLLLLAGGIGIFPMYSLLEAVGGTQVKGTLLWGAENRQLLEAAGLRWLKEMGVDYAVSTLDGSLGQKGLITDLLTSWLTEKTGESKQGRLRAAACGPRGMLKAVTGICQEAGIPIEVSLEERMGCGVGACLGCVCTVKSSNGILERRRVCKEGPVFDGNEVVWDEAD